MTSRLGRDGGPRGPGAPTAPTLATSKTILRLVLLLAPLALGRMVAAEPPEAPSAKALVEEGVRLHDAGDFEGAVAAFQRVLDEDPGNSVARFELANSYAVIGRYDECAANVDQALAGEVPESLAGPLHAVGGSCLSASGDAEAALARFEAGLRKYPGDVTLHFNIAVTLAGQNRNAEAIEHMERAVTLSPGYPSPYSALGELYRVEGRRVPSLLYFLRFVSLAPNDPRSGAAAQAIFDQLGQGVQKKSESQIEVTVATPDDEDPWHSHELILSMVGAAAYTEDEQAKSEVQRKADALGTALAILAESSAPEGMADSVVWQRASTPLFELRKQGHAEALAYLVALRAGIDGAKEWLDAHPEAMAGLEKALSPPS